MNRENVTVLAIWIGLCCIPVVGPSLSSLYFVYRVLRSMVIEENE